MRKIIEGNAVNVFVLSAIAGYTCEGDILDEVASKSIDEVDGAALTWDDTAALRFVFHLHITYVQRQFAKTGSGQTQGILERTVKSIVAPLWTQVLFRKADWLPPYIAKHDASQLRG